MKTRLGLRYRAFVRVFSFVVVLAAEASCQDAPPQRDWSVRAALGNQTIRADWPTYGGDYENNRFSTLTQITPQNVQRLAPVYMVQTGVLGAFETTPLVFAGRMYISTPYDGVVAVNAATGDHIWQRPPIRGHFSLCCGPVNRGVALADGLVFIGQVDGVLLALESETGVVRWARTLGDATLGYSVTMAPLVYKDRVIAGVAGSEFGIRGALSAYDIADGRLIWRWYVTDRHHWSGSSWRRGGGGIWTTPSVDVARDALYVTTGNPWPDSNGKSRPGRNLYTDSIVALDARTGKLKWYFQETNHDTEDLDVASPPVLLNVPDATGRSVAAIAEVGKTGRLYLLDRESGRLIRKSKNLALLEGDPSEKNEWIGGTTWSPLSFDPGLGYLVVTASQHIRPERGRSVGGVQTSNGANAWSSGYGTVSAVNAATGRVVWQDRFDQGLVGGTVSTTSGLTFVGEGNGYFDALATKTGERLWRFQTGAGVNAAPIVYSVRGHEYVAVASGGNQQFGTGSGDAVLVFGLERDSR